MSLKELNKIELRYLKMSLMGQDPAETMADRADLLVDFGKETGSPQRVG